MRFREEKLTFRVSNIIAVTLLRADLLVAFFESDAIFFGLSGY